MQILVDFFRLSLFPQRIGEEIGEQKGMEKGVEKGKKEEKIEMAKKMKKKGTDIEFISEITGLSKEAIEKL